jgi:hypothetical protein
MSKEGSSRLTYAIKNLRKHYELAKVHWNDGVQKDFEAEHLFPLETRAGAVVRGMDKLAEVVAKVRRDCGDNH